jgi:hypothetical protein
MGQPHKLSAKAACNTDFGKDTFEMTASRFLGDA